MPLYRARVPYYGLVDWPRVTVGHYADKLHYEHRPSRSWLRRRKTCRACGDLWPCTAYIWAEGAERPNAGAGLDR